MTKLHAPCLQSSSTLESAVHDSISKLGKIPEFTLIHGPYPDVNMIYMMDILEGMKKSGVIREWGVSNFSHEHLDFLDGHHLRPVLNQVEYSPYFQQRDLLDYCRQAFHCSSGISTLSGREDSPGSYNYPVSNEISCLSGIPGILVVIPTGYCDCIEGLFRTSSKRICHEWRHQVIR